jgi:protein-S-isoprenylcysteine O-methyltransferase Ste14
MKNIINQVIAQTLGMFILFALALFLPAGSLTWLAGWVFLILFFGFFTSINIWLFKHNPGLLQERMSLGRSDQKGWDKVLFPLLLALPFAWLAFIALDAVRFHWSSIPVWVQVIGAVILLFSFRENSYLSTVVRIQEDRGHKVVSSGPYRYVRHPMYSAFIPFMVGTPLLLGSWYGVLLGLGFMVVLARRAVLEESTLREELQGYAYYMTQVKYRILPYIW